MPIQQIRLDSWDAIQKFDKPGRIYRGQGDAAWLLKSSLERCCLRNDVPETEKKDFETRLFREFRRAYHHYVASAPAPENRLEWSAIMQHYGSPTRLLDFTYSIFVAAYFAYENVSADCACVWSIDAIWATRKSKDNLRKNGKTQVDELAEFTTERDENTISELIFDNSVQMAWPVNPFRLNERLRIQKGVFLVPGDVSLPHMDNLSALDRHDSDERILKILLPKSMQRQVLRNLYHMNISHTSLFPGLDGYARSLAVYHPTVVDPLSWNEPKPPA